MAERLSWFNSIRAVGGTPEKLLWSIRYAATSRRVDSPDLTPYRQVSLPKTPVKPLGLLGALGSSSIGLNTATGPLLFFKM